jgi:glycerophosphoryl diester phosphodiesterase
VALAAVLLSAAGRAASSAGLTELEAVHLVEQQARGLVVTAVRPAEEKTRPGYIVEGTSADGDIKAFVDARAARALWITRKGQPLYEWKGVTVVGHRGAVHQAPENTLASFERAIELGADLIEIDIRETKDGHLVILHDETVDRTTDGTGRVSDLTLAEIRKLDAGSWFDPKFKAQKVPTLDEALAAMKGRALPDLDFKAGTPAKLIDAVQRHDLLGRVTLYCGDWDLLRRSLGLTRDVLARPTAPWGRVGLPLVLREFQAPLVNIDWENFSESLIRDVHLAGRKAFVNVLGPNDTEFGMTRAIEAGADYIQTDRLDLLVPLLRQRDLHR